MAQIPNEAIVLLGPPKNSSLGCLLLWETEALRVPTLANQDFSQIVHLKELLQQIVQLQKQAIASKLNLTQSPEIAPLQFRLPLVVKATATEILLQWPDGWALRLQQLLALAGG